MILTRYNFTIPKTVNIYFSLSVFKKSSYSSLLEPINMIDTARIKSHYFYNVQSMSVWAWYSTYIFFCLLENSWNQIHQFHEIFNTGGWIWQIFCGGETHCIVYIFFYLFLTPVIFFTRSIFSISTRYLVVTRFIT